MPGHQRREPGVAVAPQHPQSWMQSGSPAHSLSHCLSQLLEVAAGGVVVVVAVPVAVPASEAVISTQWPSDASWQTPSADVCDVRS
jgi:hypothetical protein